MTIVWSDGGGMQSTAIARMILDGILPRPDIIVMADTSYEISTTLDYLNSVIRPAGLDVQIAPHSLATVDLYGINGDLLLPAFTRAGVRIGKFPTYCSNEWKKRVVMRWLRNNGVDDCDVWIGISTDEQERMKSSGLNWYRHVYPLVEIVPTSRYQCRSIVEKSGWPTPPKSRCYMCPNQSPRAWVDMHNDLRDDFRKSVMLEKRMREKDPDVYLHELAVPLEDAITLSARQSNMFDGCDSGYCFV